MEVDMLPWMEFLQALCYSACILRDQNLHKIQAVGTPFMGTQEKAE